MHRGLLIPEIVDLIVAELRPTGRNLGQDERKDFAALARTCKAFQDPALNLLWSEQYTLINLLKTLPPHLWTETVERHHHPALSERHPGFAVRHFRLTGPFEPADWEVPLIISLLPTLGLRYPALTRLHIDLNLPPSPFVRSMVLETVLQLERIEHLDMPQLNRAAFDHLSQLPSLRSLALQSDSVLDISSSPDDTPRNHPFPALRTIRASFPSIRFEFIIEFLGLLSDCHMPELTLFGESIVTKSTMGSVYKALAGHLSHTTLKELCIAPEISQEDGPPVTTISDYAITGYELAALFCFGNLVHLHLLATVGFDIDDPTAWDMARAWPNLRTLRLDAASVLCPPSRMTLHGLRGFAKYCKSLEDLAITFNASAIPPTDDSPDTRILQTSLVRLDVGGGALTDPAAVAGFLSDLFPNVATICTHRNESLRREHEWDIPDEMAEAYARYTSWKRVETILSKVANSYYTS
ncbi:hypothetical protein DFH07DRAFT_1061404 [Mycena maculata]|uniref:F-box domain-containing protein n=1 Tax=Mycena maculata TaxID=230809 RepID=A0AAD7J2C3_9AGAR|nr:hypothetical protein DFH07DRAFT_1061404 [Mycena maculata]